MSIATELTALSGHITNAYNAVQTKGGTIPVNKNMANLDDAILSIQSGADVTNGTVARATAASGTIPASTFLEVSDTSAYVTDEVQLAADSGSSYNSNSTQLSEDKIFIIKKSPTNSKQIVAAICDTSSGTPVMGPDNVVVTIDPASTITYQAIQSAACVALSETKALVISWNKNPSDAAKVAMYGVVCTISGNTITAGASTLITADFGAVGGKSIPPDGTYAIKLNENLVVVKFNMVTYRTHCVAITISGTSLTPGTPVQLNNTFSADADDTVIYRATDNSFLFVTASYTFGFSVSSNAITQVGMLSTSIGSEASSDNNLAYSIQRVGSLNRFITVGSSEYAVFDFDGTDLSLVTSGAYPITGFAYANSRCTLLVKSGDNTFLFATLARLTSSGRDYRLFAYKFVVAGDAVTVVELGSVDPDVVTSTSAIPTDVIHGHALWGDNVLLVYPRTASPTASPSYGAVINMSSGSIKLVGQLSETRDSVYSTDAAYGIGDSSVLYLFSYTPSSYSTGYIKALVVKPDFTVAPSVTRIDGLSIDDLSTASSGDIWIFDDEMQIENADIRRY